MKKIIIFFVFLISLYSCEDVLDKKALDSVDEEDIWNDASLVNLYLNKLYSISLPGFAGSSNTDLSEESTGTGTDNMMYGGLTSFSAYGNFSVGTYNIIRKINILLDAIDNGSIEEAQKAPIKAQAYFLRAWTYWDLLVKFYGGVPIVKNAQDPFAGDALLVSRNSARECIDFIVNDLDSAISNLPATWGSSDRGRITRGGAAALKGRVLLNYASPQFNPDNLQERWEAAYTANAEALDLCLGDGYQLYNDYANIFLAEGDANEALFITVYNLVDRYNGYENTVRPGSENNSKSSSCNPTWQMVKAYPMADGFVPGDVNSSYDYDSNYFWKNRDPRFYSTIAYNGCSWELSNQTGRKQWNFVGSASEAVSNTPTGFYCRRNVNATIESANTPYTPTDWIEIRLAEVYLNLAECAAELDKLTEAKDNIIIIRKRAGIDAGDGSYGVTATTKEEMINAVMLERQIEFAFENKRHWDLRRRNLYASTLNGTRRTGIITTVIIPSGYEENAYLELFNASIADTIDLDNDYSKYFVTEFASVLDGQDINFLQPKYNFYYILQSDLDKNENLLQTIYWTDGAGFDPLAN